mmetsp:Transcript_53017/g.128630  ORF Transcript_53017/g.128630 Transcript_53017/m.128630 type:complete len:609 (+) Transcript_53017:451-2277(+)
MTPNPNSTLLPPGRDGDGDGAQQSSSNTPNSPPFLHCTKRLDSRFSFFHNSSSSGIQMQQSQQPEDEETEDEAVDIENIHETISKEDWYNRPLSIVVVGASGDLAKKKTYPSLLHLFSEQLLPKHCVIWGYARSKKTNEEFRNHLKPYLMKTFQKTIDGDGLERETTVDDFLKMCFYHSGSSYGDEGAYESLIGQIETFENDSSSQIRNSADADVDGTSNRLFYLAVPPTVFAESGAVIRRVGMTKVATVSDDRDLDNNSSNGWTRVVIEKPFGHDLDSCNDLLGKLSSQFDERHLYRIDHYTAKEVVQNLMIFRFGNPLWEPIWNSKYIQSVTISFKEPFGTEGRGGYFDSFGIIRDILQNHLLQVLTLFAMEPPSGDDEHSIRDAKVDVLKNMEVLSLDDALLGQYDGYSDDPTIHDKETNCPTYASLRCSVNTPRWKGVPMILEAGKALNEKLCEIRVRFRNSENLSSVRRSAKRLGPSELVMRIQPKPALEIHTNIKSPGLSTQPTMSVMKMNYEDDIPNMSNPDAYTRLLLDVLRGNQGSFVRDDELRRSWEIFTPLLHAIENSRIRPEPYDYGSDGPPQRKMWMEVMTGAASSSPTKLKSSL